MSSRLVCRCPERSAGSPRGRVGSRRPQPTVRPLSCPVNLYTCEIEAGLHFYRDLLGFAETFRTPTEGIPEHVELRLNGFTIGLGTVEAAKRCTVLRLHRAARAVACSRVGWLRRVPAGSGPAAADTDDVDHANGELVAAGCTRCSHRTTAATTGMRSCAIPMEISWRSSPRQVSNEQARRRLARVIQGVGAPSADSWTSGTTSIRTCCRPGTRSTVGLATPTARFVPGVGCVPGLRRPTGRTACWGSKRDGQGKARRALSLR
jgi:catechol 2,3-dioxygenase-like lactoylglutathione lyase family enzyme